MAQGRNKTEHLGKLDQPSMVPPPSADHTITAGQAQLDQSLFQWSLGLHGHLEVLAVLQGCHPTWGWAGDNGTPLCLGAQHRAGGSEQ